MTTGPRAFEEMIKDRIVQHTCGKICSLQVEVASDRVIIHGRASSYYLKQLALQGARDALGTASATQIELHVEVSNSP